jgi:predicted RNA-binding Zn-ribbon protein involved in translation (DUF1610 family)
MSKSIDEIFIECISAALPLFERKLNAHRFQCPYCQSSGKNGRGKTLAPSDAKGYLYPVGKAWNFKCHKCGEHQSFEKFLEAHFPLLHFEYVRLRDQLGTTGFQTNCPSLETLLKKRGMLGNPPEFRPERFHQQVQRPKTAPSAPLAPKITKLPPMRSPQQQAGHQTRFNHYEKQMRNRRREQEGW